MGEAGIGYPHKGQYTCFPRPVVSNCENRRRETSMPSLPPSGLPFIASCENRAARDGHQGEVWAGHLHRKPYFASLTKCSGGWRSQ